MSNDYLKDKIKKIRSGITTLNYEIENISQRIENPNDSNDSPEVLKLLKKNMEEMIRIKKGKISLLKKNFVNKNIIASIEKEKIENDIVGYKFGKNLEKSFIFNSENFHIKIENLIEKIVEITKDVFINSVVPIKIMSMISNGLDTIEVDIVNKEIESNQIEVEHINGTYASLKISYKSHVHGWSFFFMNRRKTEIKFNIQYKICHPSIDETKKKWAKYYQGFMQPF